MARKNYGHRHRRRRRCTALLSSSRRGVETIRRLFASSLFPTPLASLSPPVQHYSVHGPGPAADTTHRCYARASSLAHLAAPSPPTSIGPRRRSFTAAAATVQSIPPPVVSSSTPSSLYGMGPGARARSLVCVLGDFRGEGKGKG
ncbi:unnamed protein product [Aphis gossypii]|uniref:Uncharacterized protein n=1 Tax=Aphis gossypii TaxID=80765 RepID=A0A9P0NPM5_APHGO|nr:unnamed protein product [Aphis gossypii]